MNDQADGALSLDDVSRRFADSERALGTARERLERLATAEENAAASAASLRQASDAVREFATAASTLMAELEQAQRQTREVLVAGARFLDGTELSALKDAVAGLARAVDDRFTALEQRVGDVHTAEARAEKAEATVATVKAKLSSRQWAKLGLD